MWRCSQLDFLRLRMRHGFHVRNYCLRRFVVMCFFFCIIRIFLLVFLVKAELYFLYIADVIQCHWRTKSQRKRPPQIDPFQTVSSSTDKMNDWNTIIIIDKPAEGQSRLDCVLPYCKGVTLVVLRSHSKLHSIYCSTVDMFAPVFATLHCVSLVLVELISVKSTLARHGTPTQEANASAVEP